MTQTLWIKKRRRKITNQSWKLLRFNNSRNIRKGADYCGLQQHYPQKNKLILHRKITEEKYRKLKLKENTYVDTLKQHIIETANKITSKYIRIGSLKKGTELLIIAVQNDAIMTNYIKGKIDNTQKLVGWLVGFMVYQPLKVIFWQTHFYTNNQLYFKQFSLAWVNSLIVKNLSIPSYSVQSNSSKSANSV